MDIRQFLYLIVVQQIVLLPKNFAHNSHCPLTTFEKPLRVTNAKGRNTNISKTSGILDLSINRKSFHTSFIVLPLEVFDIILVKYWISKHKAMVDCHRKKLLWTFMKVSLLFKVGKL